MSPSVPVRTLCTCLLAVCAATGLSLACTFTPPPPLPEELAQQQQEAQERQDAVQGGSPVDPEAPPPQESGGGAASADPDGAGGNPWGYRKGDMADLDMTAEQMQAYARAQGDPHGGQFSLAEAVDGVPGIGALWARIHTTQGVIACQLFEDQAPLTVANFVGLARGLRSALDATQTEWVTRPYYDGVGFHRVIPGFMIQGGDPSGTGRGRTGYVIPDEFTATLRHDEAGLLSMANRGPGTGGGQFFITLAPVPHLNGKHAIFGRCEEDGIQVAEKIAAKRGPGDKPRTPQVIERIDVLRQ